MVALIGTGRCFKAASAFSVIHLLRAPFVSIGVVSGRCSCFPASSERARVGPIPQARIGPSATLA
jgi:hypothetical protein